jgi:hypothetical protein
MSQFKICRCAPTSPVFDAAEVFDGMIHLSTLACHESSHGERCKSVRYRLRLWKGVVKCVHRPIVLVDASAKRFQRELLTCLLSARDHRWVQGLQHFARFLIGRVSRIQVTLLACDWRRVWWVLVSRPCCNWLDFYTCIQPISTQLEIASRLLSVLSL